MAVIWQKIDQGTRYEVRAAGETRRLYTDGVFHSSYNPQHAVMGGVWDILMLPALWYPQRIQRVLVLGVGGGAVIQQLRRYVRPAEIVGIELNPLHLTIARQFFGVDKSVATLVQGDAIDWLHHYRGPAFDLIIDDLFGEEKGEPVRAVAADSKWLTALNRNLTAHGVLVMNFIGSKEFKSAAYFHNKNIARLFKSAFQFNLPEYENIIAAFCKQAVTGQQLRHEIQNIPALASSLAQGKLEFRLRRLV